MGILSYLPNLIFNLGGLFNLTFSEELHDWCEIVNKNYLNKYKDYRCPSGENCNLCVGPDTTWKYGTQKHLRSKPFPKSRKERIINSILINVIDTASPYLELI